MPAQHCLDYTFNWRDKFTEEELLSRRDTDIFFEFLQSRGNGPKWGGRHHSRIDLSQGPIESIEFRDGLDAFDVVRWQTYEIVFNVTPDYWGVSGVQEFSIHTHGHYHDGRYVDVDWVGNDMGLGVIDSLNADASLKAPLLEHLRWLFHIGYFSGLNIKRTFKHGGQISYGWREEIGAKTPTPVWSAPSIELWDCLESMAEHLRVRPPEFTFGIGDKSAIHSVPPIHQIAGSMQNGLHVIYDIALLALWSLSTLGVAIFAFYSAMATWDWLGGWGVAGVVIGGIFALSLALWGRTATVDRISMMRSGLRYSVGKIGRKWVTTDDTGNPRKYYIRVEGQPFKLSRNVYEWLTEGEQVIVAFWEECWTRSWIWDPVDFPELGSLRVVSVDKWVR